MIVMLKQELVSLVLFVLPLSLPLQKICLKRKALLVLSVSEVRLNCFFLVFNHWRLSKNEVKTLPFNFHLHFIDLEGVQLIM